MGHTIIFYLTFFKKIIVYNQNIDFHQPLRNTVNATMYEVGNYEKNGARNVHTALIMDLTPDTKYMIQVIYDG